MIYRRYEPERARCEAEHVALWVTSEGRPDYARMQRYFSDVAKPRAENGRGPEAVTKLKADVRAVLEARGFRRKDIPVVSGTPPALQGQVPASEEFSLEGQ